MKRPKRLTPASTPLRPASTTAAAPGPSGLEIAAQALEELTQENQRLRSAAQVVPDLRVEAALYEALKFERQRNTALTKAFHDSEARFQRFRTNRLLYRSKLLPNPAPKDKE